MIIAICLLRQNDYFCICKKHIMNEANVKREELILIRITGQDRPGLTTAVMSILACYNAHILDIGQADIHSTLSLGILIRIDDQVPGR